jgi:hypothetical protein
MAFAVTGYCMSCINRMPSLRLSSLVSTSFMGLAALGHLISKLSTPIENAVTLRSPTYFSVSELSCRTG